MDNDITKMFLEKNKEIFINSLTLEMERNLESLKNTTDNCVALEINKLIMFFTKYFQESKIKYRKDELHRLMNKEKKEINNIVNKKIEEKKINLKEKYLSKKTEEEIVTQEYLNNYYEILNNETDKLNSDLDLLLKKEICTDFFPDIIKKFKLTTKEQEERINSRINILFKDTIIGRIKDETLFRDESLKNMSIESYNKYLDLNDRTTK